MPGRNLRRPLNRLVVKDPVHKQTVKLGEKVTTTWSMGAFTNQTPSSGITNVTLALCMSLVPRHLFVCTPEGILSGCQLPQAFCA